MQTFGFMPLGTVTLSYDGPFTFEVLPQETGIIEDAPKPEVLRPDCDLPPVSVADGYRAFDILKDMVRGNG